MLRRAAPLRGVVCSKSLKYTALAAQLAASASISGGACLAGLGFVFSAKAQKQVWYAVVLDRPYFLTLFEFQFG